MYKTVTMMLSLSDIFKIKMFNSGLFNFGFFLVDCSFKHIAFDMYKT